MLCDLFSLGRTIVTTCRFGIEVPNGFHGRVMSVGYPFSSRKSLKSTQDILIKEQSQANQAQHISCPALPMAR